jgi:hypothetical protein
MAVAAPAGASDRLVTENPGGGVSAFLGTFAWDGGSGRLVLFSHGQRQLAPVPYFKGGVDADLGPGRGGTLVAAYSRCNPTPRRCDLFALSVRSGREHKLRSLSSSQWSEHAVAVWNGRYLFARGHCARHCRPGGVFISSPLRRISGANAREVDLRGRIAAFTVPSAHPDPIVGIEPKELRIVHLTRRRAARECVVVVNRPLSNEYAVYSPVVTKHFVYWTSMGVEGPTKVFRRRIPSRGCRQRGPVETLRNLGYENSNSVALTGGRVFYTADWFDSDILPGADIARSALFEMTEPPGACGIPRPHARPGYNCP